MTHVRGVGCCSISLMALAGSAWGQGNAISADLPQVVALEEMVVTARRREENVQQTPISVAAFDGEALAKRNVTELEGLNGFVPNVIIGTSGSFGSTGAAFGIRGAGQDRNSVTLEPGVGLYIDGIYMGRSEASLIKFSDIRRIEVLRGPQGTLFGKNTSGGAISITTARPDNQLSAFASATYGSFDRIDAEARLNVPVSDTFFLKFSGLHNEREGYVERPDGKDVADDNTNAGRLQARWAPNQTLSVDASFDYSKIDRNGAGFVALDIDPTAPFAAISNADPVNPPYDDRWVPNDPGRRTNATGPTFHEQEAYGGSLEISVDGDTLGFKSLSAYRTYDLNFALDGDASPVRLFETAVTRDFDQYSQEFQLTGTSFESLRWVAGLYYFEERPSEQRAINQRGVGAGSNTERFTYDQETTSYAAFAQATWDVTARFAATLGARYSRDDKDLVLTEPSRFPGVQITGSAEFDSVTPRADLQYSWTDNVMTYVSYAQGFKGGGINDRIIGVPGGGFTFLPFDDEKNQTYEVGLRSELFAKRLRFNVTYFQAIYEDLQQPAITLDPAIPGRTLVLTANIGEAKVDGVELDVMALLASNFTVNLSAGYLDTRITQIDAGTLPGFAVGNDLAMSPEFSASAGAEYLVNLGVGKFRLRTDYSYIDDALTATNTGNSVINPSHGLLGASITYTAPGDSWSVSAFGTNLTDELYYTNATGFFIPFGLIQAEPARPREVGVRVEMKF